MKLTPPPIVAFKNSAVPAGLESFSALIPALKRRAIVNRRSAAQGRMWGGVTVVPSEQVGTSPTFLME
jgi:hypothetical protein